MNTSNSSSDPSQWRRTAKYKVNMKPGYVILVVWGILFIIDTSLTNGRIAKGVIGLLGGSMLSGITSIMSITTACIACFCWSYNNSIFNNNQKWRAEDNTSFEIIAPFENQKWGAVSFASFTLIAPFGIYLSGFNEYALFFILCFLTLIFGSLFSVWLGKKVSHI